MDFDVPQADSDPAVDDAGAGDGFGAPDPGDQSLATTYDRYDTDGDGIADTLLGVLDSGVEFGVVDYEQDGHGDLVWVDTDGDGEPDIVVTPNGDGSFNVKWDFHDGGWDSYTTLSAQEMAETYPELHELLTAVDIDPDHVYVPEYPSVEDGMVVGDPTQYADDWFWQSFDGSCAPASVAMVYAHYTGTDLTDLEFIELANQMQCWANGSGEGHPGMYPEGAVALLNEVGIPAEVTYGSMEALDEALAQGHGVMVAVDSDEIWYGEGDDISDHMVAVAAIDHEAGIVYLSDTGTPSGNMEAVPIEVFVDAWEDSNFTMIECSVSAEEYQAEHGIVIEAAPEVSTELAAAEPVGEPQGNPVEVEDAVVEVTKAPWLLLVINSGSLHPSDDE
ncbi:MAG: C39 family peptidase [Micrococcales bacterium]|nr:C39 family peptidase [Micrococcales bacterium]MCL2668387.1 C39 family peptidase [Micrococcales bacterium]